MDKEFRTYTLGNGIRCIYRRVNSPVVYCALSINAGSRDELDKEHGLAHFTEHMIFKGTQRRRAYHINNRLEKLGGELNAFTTKEDTVVHTTSLRSDFDKAAELISDIIFNSVFPEKELLKEREVVLDEIDSCKDIPAEMIFDHFEDMLFPDSPLGHNILGDKRSVRRFTSCDISEFTRRCHNTDQMVFSVIGNIAEGSFTRTAERYFGAVAANVRQFERTLPVCCGRFEKQVRRSTHQAHCIIGARAPGHHDRRRTALSLLMNMLGGPAANSRLNTLLREKNGLTYNVEATYNSYQDTGTAAVYFGTDKNKVADCLELIHRELTRLRNIPLPPRDLTAAKKQFTGQLAISMESRENYMLGAAKSLMVYNTVDDLEQLQAKIDAVTASDVLEIANEVFAAPSILIYK